MRRSVALIEDKIARSIHIVRGTKVMLDYELAKLYGVETKVLMQSVKRNIRRFPGDFMFSITAQEVINLRSQIVTSSWGGARKPTCAFTEQGVAMLSSVLHSARAIQVNVQIMRTFTKLRQLMETHADLRKKIEDMEKKYDAQFSIVFKAIKRLLSSPKEKQKPRIGFHV
jgi:hypothetical protein